MAPGEFPGGVGNGGRKRKAITTPVGARGSSSLQSEPLHRTGPSSSASSSTDLYSALPPDITPTPSPLSDPALVHELVNRGSIFYPLLDHPSAHREPPPAHTRILFRDLQTRQSSSATCELIFFGRGSWALP